MAGESTEQSFAKPNIAVSSALSEERPTRFYNEDDSRHDEADEPHIIRSNNSVESDQSFPSLMQEAYPNIDKTSGQADAAFDLMKANDLITIASVVQDPEIAKKGALALLTTLEHIDTGAIDIPETPKEVKLGMVAGALLQQAHELGQTPSIKLLGEEVTALRAKNDQLTSTVRLDQVAAAAELAQQSARILELEAEKARLEDALEAERQKVADRDRLLTGQSMDKLRATAIRIRSLGSIAFHHSKLA